MSYTQKRKGTAADINLMLGSMLEKAGFDVSMVLLSTRDHGFVRVTYPMERQFNYVICSVYLDGKTILLDATEKYLPVDILPERCLNGQGLVISKLRHGWIDISTKAKSKTYVSSDVSVSTSGDLKGSLKYNRYGYDALDMRKDFYKKGKETYLKEVLSKKPWEVEKSEFQNLDDLSKQANEEHALVVSEHASVAGDVIYINPFFVEQQLENPFKHEKREYPVDFGTQRELVYVSKITIPEGYVVDEIPQSRILVLPGNAAKYIYSTTQLGNTVNLSSTFQINKTLFLQDEYPNLREFYNQVVAKQAEQIVLKKK